MSTIYMGCRSQKATESKVIINDSPILSSRLIMREMTPHKRYRKMREGFPKGRDRQGVRDGG